MSKLQCILRTRTPNHHRVFLGRVQLDLLHGLVTPISRKIQFSRMLFLAPFAGVFSPTIWVREVDIMQVVACPPEMELGTMKRTLSVKAGSLIAPARMTRPWICILTALLMNLTDDRLSLGLYPVQ